jgi:hydroxylamine reductase (hybrid-cluster protein)
MNNQVSQVTYNKYNYVCSTFPINKMNFYTMDVLFMKIKNWIEQYSYMYIAYDIKFGYPKIIYTEVSNTNYSNITINNLEWLN